MKKVEIQLLAEQALGLTTQQVDELIENGEDYDTPLIEKFGVDLYTFAKIVNALAQLTPIIQDPSTNNFIHAFVSFNNGHGQVIAGQAFNCHSTFGEEALF